MDVLRETNVKFLSVFSINKRSYRVTKEWRVFSRNSSGKIVEKSKEKSSERDYNQDVSFYDPLFKMLRRIFQMLILEQLNKV